MTHTSTEQPEALRLAEYLEMIAPNECKALIVNSAAQELRRQHARILELEAAQAGRVPLSNQDAETIVRDCDYDPLLIIRATEAAHGITQEKQG